MRFTITDRQSNLVSRAQPSVTYPALGANRGMSMITKKRYSLEATKSADGGTWKARFTINFGDIGNNVLVSGVNSGSA